MGSVRLSARSSTNVNERNDGNSTSPAAFIASRSRQSAPLLPYEPSPNAKCDIDLLTCKLCGDLIQLLPTEPLVPDNSTGTDRRGYMTEQPHHSKKDALLASASTCSICRLISEGLDYLRLPLLHGWNMPRALCVSVGQVRPHIFVCGKHQPTTGCGNCASRSLVWIGEDAFEKPVSPQGVPSSRTRYVSHNQREY